MNSNSYVNTGMKLWRQNLEDLQKLQCVFKTKGHEKEMCELKCKPASMYA